MPALPIFNEDAVNNQPLENSFSSHIHNMSPQFTPIDDSLAINFSNANFMSAHNIVTNEIQQYKGPPSFELLGQERKLSIFSRNVLSPRPQSADFLANEQQQQSNKPVL